MYDTPSGLNRIAVDILALEEKPRGASSARIEVITNHGVEPCGYSSPLKEKPHCMSSDHRVQPGDILALKKEQPCGIPHP